MKQLACLLTLVVFIRHASSEFLSQIFNLTVKAAYYIVGGMQETVLWIVICIFTLMQPKSIWRAMALGAALVGIIEGMQIPICRILTLHQNYSGNTCDWKFGMPIGASMLGAYIIGVCVFYRKNLEHLKSVGWLKGVLTVTGCVAIALLVHPLAALLTLALCLAI